MRRWSLEMNSKRGAKEQVGGHIEHETEPLIESERPAKHTLGKSHNLGQQEKVLS